MSGSATDPCCSASVSDTFDSFDSSEIALSQSQDDLVQEIISDRHAHGAELQRAIHDANLCVRMCARAGCKAVDFDTRTDTCWFHGPDTACAELQLQMGVMHYKLTRCGMCSCFHSNAIELNCRVSSAPTFSYILLYFGGLLLFSYILG